MLLSHDPYSDRANSFKGTARGPIAPSANLLGQHLYLLTGLGCNQDGSATARTYYIH